MNASYVLDVLHAVEAGDRKVLKRDPQPPWCGNVEFTLDDGTRLVVYEDEGVWDYLDSIALPDGTEVRIDGRDPRWEDIKGYRPPENVIEDIYQMRAS